MEQKLRDAAEQALRLAEALADLADEVAAIRELARA